MNFRWLWLDYVDPELGLTRRERARIFSRSHGMSNMYSSGARHHSRWFDFAHIAAPGVLSQLPVFAWMYFGHVGGLLGMIVLLVCGMLFMWIVVAWLGRITWRPRVCTALREQGYDVCGKCGYWLRGLGDDVKRCPECGTTREAMLKMGYDLCDNCGYWLRGLGDDVKNCPKCWKVREPMSETKS